MQITIKAARVNKGLTQAEMANALHVTKKTVGAWESGKSMPKLDKIGPICELLDVKYDDIAWNVKKFYHR